jgi:ubiquinol-cytochrome c reductase cytochrome b subunit
MISVNNGWLIRTLHVIGSSLFIFFILMHLIRAIWMTSKIISIILNTWIIVITGWILFALSMIEGFIGYILCRGQMSYWGITVMINIVAVLPCCGKVIAELIRCAAWCILNRIFIYHFLIGIVIALMILIHILFLHNFSSSNPFINNNTSIISSYPFIFKDLYSSFITIIFIIAMFLYEPDLLGNCDNQIVANPLSTPSSILPEWYYLLFYSCLRSFPDKTIGVIVVVNLLIMAMSLIHLL